MGCPIPTIFSNNLAKKSIYIGYSQDKKSDFDPLFVGYSQDNKKSDFVPPFWIESPFLTHLTNYAIDSCC
jgi:hypothetical protein